MNRTSRNRAEPGLDESSSINLLKRLEVAKNALKARDLADMFGETPQHIRFDPSAVANWLKRRTSGY